jgi:hypothetical protein
MFRSPLPHAGKTQVRHSSLLPLDSIVKHSACKPQMPCKQRFGDYPPWLCESRCDLRLKTFGDGDSPIESCYFDGLI